MEESKRALVLAFCVYAGVSFANLFRAYVDKTTISEGETINLTLEYSGNTSREPKISKLSEQFHILSEGRSEETSIINGVAKNKTKWNLEILPKNSSIKNIVIPSIELENEQTESILIKQTATTTKEHKELKLFATTDIIDAYINQQIILTLSLKSSSPIGHASLETPVIDDAIIEKINEPQVKEIIENGVRFFVFEARFAIFANKSGTLKIPPFIFSGQLASSNAFGRGFGFFSRTKRISTASLEKSINIKPAPAEYPKDVPFLPAKSLVIIESLDRPESDFQLGKAITRKFEIKASGTLTSFLPKLSVPRIDNLNIYPEAQEKIQKAENQGLVSSASFTHVYMPTSGGDFYIPEETIYWWSTEKDKLKKTSIRALSFKIDQPISLRDQQPIASQDEEQQEEVLNKKSKIFPIWPIATGLFFILWIVTIMWFLLKKHRHSLTPISNENPLSFAKQKILTACQHKDAKEALRVFYNVKDLSDLADETKDKTLVAAMELSKALYGNTKENVSIDIALVTLAEAVKLWNFKKPKDSASLPPLYPT